MTLDEFKAAYLPYRYGYPTEITVQRGRLGHRGQAFRMGRVAVELAKVMPDQKTAYISDDGTNVGMFRFVADTAGDLSARARFMPRNGSRPRARAPGRPISPGSISAMPTTPRCRR